MKLEGNTILITGGSSGIGLRLAELFDERGNDVIVCARRADRLRAVSHARPRIATRVCDVASSDERTRLADWLAQEHPALNILVNNAGIQRRVDLTAGARDLEEAEREISINLTATIALSALLTPRLAQAKQALIVNVSSGLAFVPIAAMPVYCATKAALHSFSISLRHQLRATSVRVIEAIPPTTDTELDQGRRPRNARGISVDDVARAIVEGIERDEPEIAIGEAAGLVQAARTDLAGAFGRMNRF